MKRVAVLAMAAACAVARAQGVEGPPDRMQRGGTFVEPPAAVDAAFIPVGPNQPATSWEEPRLTLRLSLDLPLRRVGGAGFSTQGSRTGSPTVQALLRWRPLRDRAWFVQGASFQYLEGHRQRSWDPDFTYAFGYDDGQPGHWAFVYANYTGTRWRPDAARGERFANFAQGQWTASYRFDLPGALKPWLLAGDGDSALCHADLSVVPRFVRSNGSSDTGKPSVALGCRYSRPSGWFAHATAYAWPQGGKQQPWDPDFVYGVGWTAPGDPHGLTIQYMNYSGNRWPGRSRAPDEGTPASGSLNISWGTSW